MKKLIILPTYILYRSMRPFLAGDHLLKPKVTLKEWYKNSTDLNKVFGLYFWICILTFLIFIVK